MGRFEALWEMIKMGRQGFHDVKHILHVLQNPHRHMAPLPLDTEQVFDLPHVIARFGCQETFCTRIKFPHLDPLAEELASEPFNITRGFSQDHTSVSAAAGLSKEPFISNSIQR